MSRRPPTPQSAGSRPPLTNPRSERVKAVAGLARRSLRERSGRFLVEGPQGVREAIRYAAPRVTDVYVTLDAAQRYAADIVDPALDAGLIVHECSPEVLAAMADASSPQGVLAVVRASDPADHLDAVLAGSPRLVVFLTHVRDPGNAGTVLRAADAAGADAVLVSQGSVDIYSPKVVRSTAGSLFHLPVVTGLQIDASIDALRAHGIRVLAADGTGRTLLPNADLGSPHAWVMGNEAWGLPADLLQRCDDIVAVPIHGKAESLNLAMAATVCLYASAGSLPAIR